MTPRRGPADRGSAVRRQVDRTDPAFVERVPRSHAATRSTLRVGLAFVVAGAGAAALGGSRWLAVHLFLTGGAAVVISGVTLMLTVTWSAAPAPAAGVVLAQRAAIAVGAAGVVLTREVESFPDWSTGVAGVLYLVGLVMLIWLLVATARRGEKRRFDVAVAFYCAAATAALVAVGLGIEMASAGVTVERRSVHVLLNLLGFVGVTMLGSLPFFAATVVRSKMAEAATPARLAALLGALVSVLVGACVAVSVGSDALLAATIIGYMAAVAGTYSLVPRPTRRQIDWAGPRLAALWCGGAWWMVALTATAYEAADGRVPFLGRWLEVLLVGAFAQILWGSLAYLIPMLRGGGHQKLSEGFAEMRSWLGLAALNLAAAAFAVEQAGAGLVCLTLVVCDAAWRTRRVGLAPLERPGRGGPV